MIQLEKSISVESEQLETEKVTLILTVGWTLSLLIRNFGTTKVASKMLLVGQCCDAAG